MKRKITPKQAEELLAIMHQAKEMKIRADELRTVVKEVMPVGKFKLGRVEVDIFESQRSTLDKDKLIKAFGAAEIEKYEKVIDFLVLKVRRI